MNSTNRTSPSKRDTATGNLAMSATAKQKQMSPSSDLLRSFKATTNLAHGLTKERIKIQNDL